MWPLSLLYSSPCNCYPFLLCIRGLYRSKNHIPPPLHMISPRHTPKFTPLTLIGVIFPLLHLCSPFNFTFPLSFVIFPFFPSHFPLFSLTSFHIFPPNDISRYSPPGGRGISKYIHSCFAFHFSIFSPPFFFDIFHSTDLFRHVLQSIGTLLFILSSCIQLKIEAHIQ